MDNIDYNELEPGRELDAMVWMARNGQKPDVMKCRHVDGDVQPHAGYPSGHISPPNSSTDIEDALATLEEFTDVVLEKSGEYWSCWFRKLMISAERETLAHAICISVLKVKADEMSYR